MTWRNIVVAGIPIVHVGDTGSASGDPFDYWPDLGSDRAPIEVRHARYEDESEPASGVRTIIDAPELFERFGVDERGALAVRATAGPAPSAAEWLRTREAGLAYVISRAAAVPTTAMRWRWDRTLFAYGLAARGDGLVAHAAGFAFADGVVLCPGVSGTGKSTLVAQLADAGLGPQVLSDDRVALVRTAGGVVAHGTPWRSTAGLSAPLAGPLRAVVVPAKHGTGELGRLAPADALPLILRAVALPFWDRAMLADAMATLDAALTELPLFTYAYTPGPGSLAPLLRALTRIAG